MRPCYGVISLVARGVGERAVAVLICSAILCSMGNKSTERVYEVSFHLVPTLDEDGVSGVFARVKKVVSEAGKVLGEVSPVLRDLAYTIRHTVRQRDGTYNRYDEAYFGSVKFSSSQGAVKQVEQSLLSDEEVLRFLLLETSADDTRVGEVLPDDEEEKDKEEGDADADTSTPAEREEGESGIAEQTDEDDAK